MDFWAWELSQTRQFLLTIFLFECIIDRIDVGQPNRLSPEMNGMHKTAFDVNEFETISMHFLK